MGKPVLRQAANRQDDTDHVRKTLGDKWLPVSPETIPRTPDPIGTPNTRQAVLTCICSSHLIPKHYNSPANEQKKWKKTRL
jgi:hypothetical protein